MLYVLRRQEKQRKDDARLQLPQQHLVQICRLELSSRKDKGNISTVLSSVRIQGIKEDMDLGERLRKERNMEIDGFEKIR